MMWQHASIHDRRELSHASPDCLLRLQDVLPWNFLQVAEVALGDSKLGEQGFSAPGGLLARAQPQAGSALHHCAVEQSFGGRCCQNGTGFCASPGLSKNHHLLRITAELLNVVAHPFEGGDEIEDS